MARCRASSPRTENWTFFLDCFCSGCCCGGEEEEEGMLVVEGSSRETTSNADIPPDVVRSSCAAADNAIASGVETGGMMSAAYSSSSAATGALISSPLSWIDDSASRSTSPPLPGPSPSGTKCGEVGTRTTAAPSLSASSHPSKLRMLPSPSSSSARCGRDVVLIRTDPTTVVVLSYSSSPPSKKSSGDDAPVSAVATVDGEPSAAGRCFLRSSGTQHSCRNSS
mmetsp:Transcript_547/g.1198  ORF Transcript_547/g.1198 Transcript_547/m.1198 type:complete len:224 (-) Transcript_547:480-1151(-)